MNDGKRRRELTESEIERLRAITEPETNATIQTVVDGFVAGQTAAELVEEVARKRRGGARPGAGRPRGKWERSQGRRADAAMCFRVTSEFKARFDAQARAAGMNGTEYLKSLVENAAAR